MLPEGIVLPTVSASVEVAMRSCLRWVFANYDIVAVVASGTIVRGSPDKRSDLDIHVLHRHPFRQRVQRFFDGIPCEIFVNPPWRIPKYFDEETRSRRPCTAHMFATGHVLYDPENVTPELISQAAAVLSQGPPAPEAAARAMLRYGPATMFEDAEDLADRDPDAALLLIGNVVYELVRCRFALEPGWIPRHKDYLAELRILDAEAARLVVEASTGPLRPRLEAARRLCMQVTGVDGFLEWESPREELQP